MTYFGAKDVRSAVSRLECHDFASLADSLCRPEVHPFTREEFFRMSAKERQSRKGVRIVLAANFQNSPSPRQTEHAKSCDLITLDIDRPKAGEADDARMILAQRSPAGVTGLEGIPHILWHTVSSTPKEPRLRLIVSASGIPVARYASAVRTIAEKIGLTKVTKESLVPVQPMFWPTMFEGDDLVDEYSPIIVSVLEGTPFAVEDIIDAGEASMAPVDGEDAPVPTPANPDAVADITFLRAPMDGITLEDAQSALEHLDPDMGMHQWVEVGMALKHQFASNSGTELGEAYDLWDVWSAKGKKYVDADETAYRWKSLKANPTDRAPVTIRSLFKQAIQRGWVNTSLAKRGYLDTLAWIRAESRSTEQLLDQGAQRIAKIGPLVGTLERKSLVAALRERLHDREIIISVPDLRKEVRKLELESAKTTGLPPWSKGLCFVTSSNIFYRHTTDRRFTPEVVDLMYSVPPVGDEAPMRPRDYLIQVAGVPVVEALRYEPARTGAGSRFFNEDGVPFVNTYRAGYAKPDPERADEAGAIFWAHVCNLIREDEYRRTLVDFLAYHVQHPGKKVRWAILIQGAQGCGKTALAVAMTAVLGRRNIRKLTAMDVLEGSHNDWAYGQQLVVMEEVRIIGQNRFGVMDKLKPCISDDEISLHRKYENHQTVPNTSNYLMFTNHHDSLAVNDQDRRYFVLSSPMQLPEHVAAIGGEKYFDNLFGMISGNAGGLRAWLEKWPISESFKPEGRAPITQYLRDLAVNSASPLNVTVMQTIDDQPHALVRRDLVALDCLRACMASENVPPFTDQALAAVVREAGFQRAGRHSVGGARRQLWVRGVEVREAKRVAEEREELL